MKAGLYRGLSKLEYEAIPAIRWSRLSEYLRSPAHGRLASMRAENSDALTVGDALHRAVLEPSQFEVEFGMVPEDAPPKRSKEDKLWWAQFEADNAGRTMLKPDDFRGVREMATSIYGHKRAEAMLNAPGNAREVSAVWMDPEFGLWCKARLDLLTKWNGVTYVVDVKTARDASPYGFSGDIARYYYHGQAAWYVSGLNVLAPFERRFAFIVVEKETAVSVVYDMDDPSMEQGAKETRLAFRRFVESEAAQSWPGYPDGFIGLPAWKLKGGDAL